MINGQGKELCNSIVTDRLAGHVVKASASRAEDPGFESRLRRVVVVVVVVVEVVFI